MKSASSCIVAGATAVVATLIGVVLVSASANADGRTDQDSVPCSGKICVYQTTSTFEPTTASELADAATPIGDCPEAAAAYAAADREVDGFFGPCPTGEDISEIEPMTTTERVLSRRARSTLRGRAYLRPVEKRATYYCPPDCVGTSGNDVMYGDSGGNDMRGAGSYDYLETYAGVDEGKGEGGDYDWVNAGVGNGDIGRGGDGDGDTVLVWNDSGKDYAYGSNGADDDCYVDPTDDVADSCETVYILG